MTSTTPIDLTRYTPKPSKPYKFFNRVRPNGSSHIQTPGQFLTYLKRFSDPLEEPIAGISDSFGVYFRGQSEANHGLTSSLYRLCHSSLGDIPSERHLQTAESAIIEAMRDEGLGRLMTDLELLEVLQHHGIPTRLIDVSTSPLEALFFAVDSNDSRPGRLFIIRLDEEQPEWWRDSLDDSSAHLPWTGMDWGSSHAQGRWTSLVQALDADALDLRMRAQRGKFLVGGLNRRYGGRSMAGCEPRDFPEISNLGINFKRPLTGTRNFSWPATGWTYLIPAEWKRPLREHLANLPEPITRDSMYPAIGEVARLARVVARKELSQH